MGRWAIPLLALTFTGGVFLLIYPDGSDPAAIPSCTPQTSGDGSDSHVRTRDCATSEVTDAPDQAERHERQSGDEERRTDPDVDDGRGNSGIMRAVGTPPRRRDANDSPGRLDIRKSLVVVRDNAFSFSVYTAESWRTRLLRRSANWFQWAIKTRRGTNYVAKTTFASGRLRIRVTDFGCAEACPKLLQTVNASRPNERGLKFSIPKSVVRGDYKSLRLQVQSSWASERCRCFDLAPNRAFYKVSLK